MPTVATLGRAEFVSWLAGDTNFVQREVSDLDEISPRLAREQVMLIWKNAVTAPSSVLNPVVVVGEGEAADFFAWTSTYVSSFHPFSAYFRVLEVGDFRYFDPGGSPEALSVRELEMLAGIVVAEAATQIGSGAKSTVDISVGAAFGTLSYALLGALAVGMHPSDLVAVADNWLRARRVTADTDLNLSADQITNFWLMISSQLRPAYAVASNGWVSDLQEGVRLHLVGQEFGNSSAWKSLTAGLVDVRILSDASGVSREDQMRNIDRAIVGLQNSRTPDIVKDAISGYLLSKLSNGSADYIATANSFRANLPTVALWAALFSIGRPGFDFLTSGQGLGRRIVKSLVSSNGLFSPPASDVTLRELEVLGRSGAPRIRTNAAAMTVEIAPFVSGRFRVSAQPRSDERVPSQPDVDLVRARSALEELNRALGGPIAKQLGLFDKRPAKKGYTSRPTKK